MSAVIGTLTFHLANLSPYKNQLMAFPEGYLLIKFKYFSE